MTDLLTFIEATKGTSLKIEVTSKDLLEFADALVERAAAKARAEIERQSDVEYIPKKEAIDLLGVCDATLWHWARSGILVLIVIPDSIGDLPYVPKQDVCSSDKMCHLREALSAHAHVCVCALAYVRINVPAY